MEGVTMEITISMETVAVVVAMQVAMVMKVVVETVYVVYVRRYSSCLTVIDNRCHIAVVNDVMIVVAGVIAVVVIVVVIVVVTITIIIVFVATLQGNVVSLQKLFQPTSAVIQRMRIVHFFSFLVL